MASSSSAVSTANVSKSPFTIVKINQIGIWTYDLSNENCGICRDSNQSLCLMCESGDTNPAKPCQVIIGKCGHAYHSHCINGWLDNNSVCPICAQTWDIATILPIGAEQKII
jgi:hypothetical protein